MGDSANGAGRDGTSTGATGTGSGGTGTGRPAVPGRLRSTNYKWLALSNTTIGILAATVNGSIVIISLPAIFRGIHLDPLTPGNISYLLWMLMGYLLVSAVLVVTLGRLGDMYGRVRMYNLGFAIFGIAALALPFDPFTGPNGALWLILWQITTRPASSTRCWTRQAAERRSLPRYDSALVARKLMLVVFGVLFAFPAAGIAASPIVSFITELQWYDALGYGDVYTTRVGLQAVVTIGSFVLAFIWLVINVVIALRVRTGAALRAVGIRRSALRTTAGWVASSVLPVPV